MEELRAAARDSFLAPHNIGVTLLRSEHLVSNTRGGSTAVGAPCCHTGLSFTIISQMPAAGLCGSRVIWGIAVVHVFDPLRYVTDNVEVYDAFRAMSQVKH